MSRSPLSPEHAQEEGVLESYTEAVLEMGRKILDGQSFSGRERHVVYLNTGGSRFANISAISGLDFADDGRGLAVTDWDFDGDLDLWISNRTAPRLRFLRNDTTSRSSGAAEGKAAANGFLAFRLTGNGTTSNRDAIGARVTVRVGGVPLLRTLKAGEGFLSQSSRWLHYGLGRQESVESVAVRWPDGSEQAFADIEPNRFYEIEQGGAPAVFTPPTGRVKFSPSEIEPPASTQAMRLRLATRTPLPRLDYRDFGGEERRVREHLDEPLLLNLWATWCVPCRAELRELDAAGAHVLALSLDGLGVQSATTPEQAIAFMKEKGYRFDVGFADERLLDLLQLYRQAMFLDRRPLAIPTSFLIDTDGAVAAIYVGPVTSSELAEDIAHLSDSDEARRARAVPFPGRWQTGPPNITPTELARSFISDGNPEEAMRYLEEFGSDHDNPLRPQVFMELAMSLRRKGHTEQAERIAAAAQMLRERQSDAN